MLVHLCKDTTYGVELLDKHYLDIVDPDAIILKRYEVPDNLVLEYNRLMGQLQFLRANLEKILLEG